MREALRLKLKKWFGNRMPVGNVVRLNQRSTYIWPTRSGYLMLGIVLLMMIGATNYQNNLAFALTFLIIGIGLVGIVATFKNMQGLEFSLINVGELFAGHPVSFYIGLKRAKNNQHFCIGAGITLQQLSYTDVVADGYSKIEIESPALERGWQELPRLMVSSSFPFGWMRTWAYFKFNDKVLVYPKPLEPIILLADSANEDDQSGVKTAGNEDLYALKSYQPGDSLARVDWKAFARERGMHIKEFASFQAGQLCFNWSDFANSDVEERLSFLAYLVLDAASQNLSYRLVIPNFTTEFEQGEQHRMNCLRALALFAKSSDGKRSDRQSTGDE